MQRQGRFFPLIQIVVHLLNNFFGGVWSQDEVAGFRIPLHEFGHDLQASVLFPKVVIKFVADMKQLAFHLVIDVSHSLSRMVVEAD